MFLGRGLNQKKKIATSSLILICTKKKPSPNHKIECINLPSASNLKESFNNLRKNRKKYSKHIAQKHLENLVFNWNPVKWNEKTNLLYAHYKKNSLSSAMYWDHKKSLEKLHSSFYFDMGYILDKTLIQHDNTKGIIANT